MKNIFKTILYALAVGCSLTACSDWTDTETQNPTDLTKNIRTEAYYTQLREFKKSDHPLSMGWFGGWAGRNASLKTSLSGLPDSLDFVSLWGNWKNLSQEQKDDLKYVQETKGTKVLICWQVHDIGDQLTPDAPEGWAEKNPGKIYRHEYWHWGNNKEENLKAVEAYAKAILDTIRTYNYDGFDLDAEPFIKQIGFEANEELWHDLDYIHKFVEVLATELGPQSGTDKLLVIDGMPEGLKKPEMEKYFNYFILQAYHNKNSGYRRVNDIQTRFDAQYDHFKDVLSPEALCKKIIITENFEDGQNITAYRYIMAEGIEHQHDYEGLVPNSMMTWQTTSQDRWGRTYTLSDTEKRWVSRSIITYAMWNPTINGKVCPKGGIGTFHMEYEYDKDGTINTYPNLRTAIQLQNPNKK